MFDDHRSAILQVGQYLVRPQPIRSNRARMVRSGGAWEHQPSGAVERTEQRSTRCETRAWGISALTRRQIDQTDATSFPFSPGFPGIVVPGHYR